MENQINSTHNIGEKRTYEVYSNEIEGKLSSKRDWYTYLEQHL